MCLKGAVFADLHAVAVDDGTARPSSWQQRWRVHLGVFFDPWTVALELRWHWDAWRAILAAVLDHLGGSRRRRRRRTSWKN